MSTELVVDLRPASAEIEGLLYTKRLKQDIQSQVSRLRSGEPLALARAISVIENRAAGWSDLLKALFPHTGHARRIGLTGAPGSGKSTLLHILGGVDLPTSGEVLLEGVDLTLLDDDRRTLLRRERMGFIFQSFNLLPAFSAEENVTLPLELGRVSASEARRRAADMLKLVGVWHRRTHVPSTLSGGEQQRVAIARALVVEPALLLADEPTGNLDTRAADAVFALLREINRERGTAFLIVTHDRRMADRCDRIAELVDGKIVADSAL